MGSGAEGAPLPGLRELVVFLDGREEDAGALEFAAALAREHGARLIGVFAQAAAQLSEAEMFARGGAIREVIEAARERLSGAGTARRELFEDVVSRLAIPWEWRSIESPLADELVPHARYADLAVVARQDPSEPRVGPPGLVESLVLTSGRPILVLPPPCRGAEVRRILVGWNAGPEATRAVAGAMPLLARAEAVEVLVVDPKGDAPGHGQEPGADIARHLARHGAPVEVRRLASDGGDVGHVILSRASAFGADLVVMGAYGHSRVREWVFGGATRTALLEAPLPVLMSA